MMAYEVRISDWSSDVCSFDLTHRQADRRLGVETGDRQFDQPRFAGGNPVAADLEDFVVRLICCHSFHRNSSAAVMACSPRSLGARVIGLGIAFDQTNDLIRNVDADRIPDAPEPGRVIHLTPLRSDSRTHQLTPPHPNTTSLPPPP